jgi:hypothetical protein
MTFDTKTTSEQREQMKAFVKPYQAPKQYHPKEVIGPKSEKTLPVRGR